MEACYPALPRWAETVSVCGRRRSSHQLSRDLFVEDIADGERNNYCVLAAEEAVNFAECVVRVVEADEESFLAPGAQHGGLEFVYVGAADLVRLPVSEEFPPGYQQNTLFADLIYVDQHMRYRKLRPKDLR